jgi:hypothetical protein
MDLHWILSPVTQWSALALAMVSCLTLFLSVKREIAMQTRSAKEATEAAQGGLSNIAKEVEELKQGMLLVESSAAAAPPGESINLTRRTQALRMHSRGEAAPTIAAALRVPLNEIRLLVKIHEAINAPMQQ